MIYIIQEKLSNYDYRDVITCDSLGLARKYVGVLKAKYPYTYYRIIRGLY